MIFYESFVYSRGPKQKIELRLLDARLNLRSVNASDAADVFHVWRQREGASVSIRIDNSWKATWDSKPDRAGIAITPDIVANPFAHRSRIGGSSPRSQYLSSSFSRR